MALATDNPWKLFLFSGIGSCAAEASTVPIDTVKVRLQLQGELGATRQYTGIVDAFSKIVRTEGVRGLYKGIQPALLRQATYGSLRIGMYEGAAGILSGALSSAICNPTDVVKVRMQADMASGDSRPRYRGLVHAFTDIYKKEGLRGMYQGVSPTVQRACIVAAVELTTYDECKYAIVKYLSLKADSTVTHFASALSAGFLATLASSPADVIKSRVMNQPVGLDGYGLTYRNTLDCLQQSVKAEGVLALWKGFWPNFGRIGPHTIIMFMVIEQLRNTFG